MKKKIGIISVVTVIAILAIVVIFALPPYMGNRYYNQALAQDTIQNYNEAIALYEKAADKGNLEAMNRLGQLYSDSTITTSDYPKAYSFFQKAYEGGSKDAIYPLAMCYYEGKGAQADTLKAMSLFEEASNGPSFYVLGDNALAKGDTIKAKEYYKKSADLNDNDGLRMYAKALIEWDGSEQVKKGGLTLIERAANAGDLKSAFNASCYYDPDNDYGVAPDSDKAFKYLKMAAEGGYTNSYCNIGNSYKDGIGTPVSLEQAIYWYNKGVEVDDPICLFNLGACYYNGEGVLKDKEKAMELFERSSALGYQNATNTLENLRKVEAAARQRQAALNRLNQYLEQRRQELLYGW